MSDLYFSLLLDFSAAMVSMKSMVFLLPFQSPFCCCFGSAIYWLWEWGGWGLFMVGECVLKRPLDVFPPSSRWCHMKKKTSEMGVKEYLELESKVGEQWAIQLFP